MSRVNASLRWLVLLAGVLAFVTWRFDRPPVILPVDRIQDSHWADEARCADCHSQASQFWQTGHAQTLIPAAAPESRARLEQLKASASHLDPALRVSLSGDPVIQSTTAPPAELQLDWCFGSGRHARTWVGTIPDSWGATDLVEFRWTWYAALDGFGITPGQQQDPAPGYFEHLGVLFDHPKARHCFGCHATQLPLSNGRIEESRIHPGVTCQRCHGSQQTHVASDGEVVTGSLKNLSQLESIHRCAQCHRRAEEQPEENVVAHNEEIVRFQPVGLVQSPCFQGSPEMTCTTCHDPHRPLEAQDSLGIWQCLQCHDGTSQNHALCAAGRVDDCLSCHMPKVQGNAPVRFTDHWIRVRSDSESQP